MAKRSIGLIVLVGFACGAAPGASRAATEPSPNAPMSTVDERPPEAAPGVALPDSIADDRAMVVLPQRELAPIGAPNGPLSSRPVEKPSALEVGESAPASPGVLEKLDPRTNGAVRVAGALAGVLLLIVVLSRVLRRFAGPLGRAGRPSGVVEILARYPIARGQQLLILKVARRIILLHQTGSTMATLSEIVDADEVAGVLGRIEAGSRDRLAERFHGVLERFGAEYAGPDGAARPAGRPSAEMFAGAEMVDLTKRPRAGRGTPR